MRLLFIMRLLLVLCCLSLSACKVDLYTGLSEKEANEMLAVLMAEGLAAEKKPAKSDEGVTLAVDKSELTTAIMLLNYKGYPKEKFASVGNLFKKDGLISSPLEEKARYIFGLSQQISETLSQLDGVITARVQVVQPENNGRAKDKAAEPASASVFIKYSDDYDLEEAIPKIKMLVVNSVESLGYENVSVALFPSQAARQHSNVEYRNLLSVKVAENSILSFWLLVAVPGLLAAFSIMLCWWLWQKNQTLKTRLSDHTDPYQSDSFPANSLPDLAEN